ncbi:uncharacterized protein [Procambarus clarkii]|nr:uncharacterized protein LOC123759458 [Procambarus clarkii]
MANKDRMRRAELMILKKEEVAVRELIEMYRNSLNRLQVEELTIRSQLGHIQDVELKSRNNTPLESAIEAHSYSLNHSLIDAPHNSDVNQTILNNMSRETGVQNIIMNELQINQSTLNLDAAPLIQRMLNDSEVYEEDDDDDDMETKFEE